MKNSHAETESSDRYFYSSGPLSKHGFSNGKPHVSQFTINRYRYLLGCLGLNLIGIKTDKLENSSKAWAWPAPIIRLCTKRKWGTDEDIKMQNSKTAPHGRKLVAIFEKPNAED